MKSVIGKCVLLFLLTGVGIAVGKTEYVSLRFDNAPLQIVVNVYAEYSGKQVEVVSGVNASLSFHSETKLTQEEAMKLIEQHLAEQNIGLFQITSNRMVAAWLKLPPISVSSDSHRSVPPITTPKYDGTPLKKHLENFNREAIRQGLPPLPNSVEQSRKED